MPLREFREQLLVDGLLLIIETHLIGAVQRVLRLLHLVGVSLPAGDHALRFIQQPPSFRFVQQPPQLRFT